MPTFEELSQRTTYPVLHTQRNDGVIIVATRVPLTDVRLQQWGWILSQAYKVEHTSQDEFDGLIDGAGKRYSKIHSLADMQYYIEKWKCQDWEVGYFAIGRATDNRVTVRLEDKIVQEDTFKNSIESLKIFQEKQTYALLHAISQQEKSFQGPFENLSNGVDASLTKMHQEILSAYADQQEHLGEFVQNAFDNFDKAQSNDVALISLQTKVEQLNEALKIVENSVALKVQTTVIEEIVDQVTQLKTLILGKIEQQPQLSEHDLSEHFNKLDQKQLDQLETLMVAMEEVQKCIGEIKDILVPIDIDDANTNNVDDAIKKLSKSAKTLSEKYVTSLINTNSKYHNTVDKQVKDSFGLTRIILYVGVCLFAFTVISLLVTFSFHSDEIALLTNGVGATLSAVALGLGGLNKVHDEAAKRQLSTLANLSRSVKAAHAQFIIEQVDDEVWQKTQFERLLNQLGSDEK